MGLLKKKGKGSSGFAARVGHGGVPGGQISPLRPVLLETLPPCTASCPSGNDIRGWLMAISLREKVGLSLDQACEKAWRMAVATNPFPAVMGRVCPHPCESHCNRKDKDGEVAIGSVERFVGDHGIEHGLRHERLPGEEPKRERVAVVGAGPSGLSCAFQLARRGYRVTVLEGLPRPGGMLRYGIPVYRLPREILDAEIDKILDLGVELRLGARVGTDIDLAELRARYQAIYIAIGAHQGRQLGIPGEEGPGIWTGTEFLKHVNLGKRVEIGGSVAVVGGGDTAVDAARVSRRLTADAAAVSRRLGAAVTILYRRTRAEMPAIEREIEEAIQEGIRIEYLAAPNEILRDAEGKVRAMLVQRMELGEPDESGRRHPLPIPGHVYELPVDTVITAVSQQPELAALRSAELGTGWLYADGWGRTGIDRVWTGGDNLGLGLATTSIGHARRAAESIHAFLRGGEPSVVDPGPPILSAKIKLDWYQPKPRGERRVLGPAQRLADPAFEIDLGLGREQALEETTRCFSCGQCFGCENCWMYCQNNCFSKVQGPLHGHFYRVKLEVCDGCKKCWEECPCGFIVGQ